MVRQLYAGVRAGYNSAQALDIAYTQAKGRLKQVLDSVTDDIIHGAYLYEALEAFPQYFSPLFINLIKTGELSGSLRENLKRLIDIIEKDIEFKHKVRAAMMYPLFIFVAVLGLGLAVAFFVLPNLLPLFGSLDIELPLSTRILLVFARWFDAYGFRIFFGFVGSVFFLFWLSRRKFSKPVTHWIALRTPIFGSLNRQLSMARFGRSLASLLRSGVPIEDGLKIIITVMPNYYYQRIITAILPQVRKGQTLSGALEGYSSFFDEIFIKLLALGESTAGLEDSCDNVAEFFESEVDESMKNLAVSLEPILIIFVGLIVGFVAFSILGPIYKITGSIR